jgi:membrane associated rhomboid family serine protease
MTHDRHIGLNVAFAAHLFGLGFGVATIISLVPAVIKFVRCFYS